jgi:hypothetical protein
MADDPNPAMLGGRGAMRIKQSLQELDFILIAHFFAPASLSSALRSEVGWSSKRAY